MLGDLFFGRDGQTFTYRGRRYTLLSIHTVGDGYLTLRVDVEGRFPRNLTVAESKAHFVSFGN